MPMRILCSLLIVLSCGAPAFAAAPPPTDEQSVLAFENELCVAFRNNDAAAIAAGEDVHYALTNTDSRISTRADDIADAKSGSMRYAEFRNHDMQVTLYGDTAIVRGITSLKGTSNGKAFAHDVRFTDTLVRRNGAWQLVAGHVTPAKPST
jgi:ketosteroid isomerase-like protein